MFGTCLSLMSLDEWTSRKTGLLSVLIGQLASFCVPAPTVWNIATLLWKQTAAAVCGPWVCK